MHRRPGDRELAGRAGKRIGGRQTKTDVGDIIEGAPAVPGFFRFTHVHALGALSMIAVDSLAIRLVARTAARRMRGPFAAAIRCTADTAKADKRTRSKWSRVLRYAAAYKPDSEPLDQFVKRKGGINACAARFARRLGRVTAKRSKRRLTRG